MFFIAFIFLLIFASLFCIQVNAISIEENKTIISKNNEQIGKFMLAKNKIHEMADFLRKLEIDTYGFIDICSTKWIDFDAAEKALIEENDSLQVQIDEEINQNNTKTGWKYIGARKVTGYTSAKSENGGYDVTCKGIKLTSVIGLCAATDTLPYGTKIYIDGIGYRTIMDTGCGNSIDVLVNTKSETYQIGNQQRKIWIIE